MNQTKNEEKIQELLNEPCWESKPYLIGMDKVGVEDVMERFAEWKDEKFEKVIEYAETCYGVFTFNQREKFIDTIKKIYEGE